CGAQGLVPRDKRCPVCEKLISEGFHPLDVIRSSYRMQRKRLDVLSSSSETVSLFDDGRPLVASAAWACAVYAMVPYLGILFIGPALVLSGGAYLRAQQNAQPGEVRNALVAATVAVLLLAIQLVLWWLLYLIPEIG